MVVGLSSFRRANDKVPRSCPMTIGALATRLSTFPIRADVAAHIERDLDLVRTGRAHGWLAKQVTEKGESYVLDNIPRWGKNALTAWSPATYPAGATRLAENVLELSCLVLDVDDGTALDRVWALWSDRPRLLYTSWSHSAAKPKCRLVVPLAEPIPGAGWVRVWAWMARHARASGVEIDQACKNPDRIYYAPYVQAEVAPRESRAVLEGELLRVDWRALPDPDAARRAAMRARRPPLVLMRGEKVPPWARYRDPAAREDLALRLGARIAGSGFRRRADRAPCPSCADRTVWFWLEPDQATNAYCDHRRSCGWSGPLHQLEQTCR